MTLGDFPPMARDPTIVASTIQAPGKIYFMVIFLLVFLVGFSLYIPPIAFIHISTTLASPSSAKALQGKVALALSLLNSLLIMVVIVLVFKELFWCELDGLWVYRLTSGRYDTRWVMKPNVKPVVNVE